MLGLLVWLERHRTFTGSTFLLAVMFYGLLRLVGDSFRHFEENVILVRSGGMVMTANQLISGLAMLIALFIFVWRNARSPSQKPVSSGR